MGKNGASRNYTNRTYAINSKRTYQDRYGQNQKFIMGQKNESTKTTKSSRLLKITTK